MKDEARAGLTCIKLFLNSNDIEVRLGFLESAKKHFMSTMIYYQNFGSDQESKHSKPVLDEGDIAKHLKTVSLQIEVTKAFGFQNKSHSLFDSWKKKCGNFSSSFLRWEEEKKKKRIQANKYLL